MAFDVKWPTEQASNLAARIQSKGSTKMQDATIGKIAKAVRDIAKTYAPRKTGNLARTIYARKISDCNWETGSPLIYAWAVEFGSGVYGEGPTATGNPIEPRTADYLYFRLNGKWVRLRFVLGQHPQPFLRPALQSVDINKEFKDATNESEQTGTPAETGD